MIEIATPPTSANSRHQLKYSVSGVCKGPLWQYRTEWAALPATGTYYSPSSNSMQRSNGRVENTKPLFQATYKFAI
jgi:hypothetical protein